VPLQSILSSECPQLLSLGHNGLRTFLSSLVRRGICLGVMFLHKGEALLVPIGCAVDILVAGFIVVLTVHGVRLLVWIFGLRKDVIFFWVLYVEMMDEGR
jgi:hypothetical protein